MITPARTYRLGRQQAVLVTMMMTALVGLLMSSVVFSISASLLGVQVPLVPIAAALVLAGLTWRAQDRMTKTLQVQHSF